MGCLRRLSSGWGRWTLHTLWTGRLRRTFWLLLPELHGGWKCCRMHPIFMSRWIHEYALTVSYVFSSWSRRPRFLASCLRLLDDLNTWTTIKWWPSWIDARISASIGEHLTYRLHWQILGLSCSSLCWGSGGLGSLHTYLKPTTNTIWRSTYRHWGLTKIWDQYLTGLYA